MKLEQSFEVAAPIDRVWRTLIDVEHVAPCLPGASVTGRNEDGSYNGTFTVKIGPTTASYSGKLEMEQVDEVSHTATMQAQGTDKRGQGGAKATIFSRLAPANGTGTRVEVVTDYHITGRLARFGRGGMIEDISERLLKEFAKRLQSSLSAQPAAERAVAAGAAAEAGARAQAGTAEPAATAAEPPAEVVEPAAEAVPFPSPSPSPELESEPPAEVVDPEADTVVPPAEVVDPEADTVVPPAEVVDPEADTVVPPAPASPRPDSVPPSPPDAPLPPALEPTATNPPSEPVQGLSLMGSVLWARIKRNPAPAAAAGVTVVLLVARRSRRRHGH